MAHIRCDLREGHQYKTPPTHPRVRNFQLGLAHHVGSEQKDIDVNRAWPFSALAVLFPNERSISSNDCITRLGSSVRFRFDDAIEKPALIANNPRVPSRKSQISA